MGSVVSVEWYRVCYVIGWTDSGTETIVTLLRFGWLSDCDLSPNGPREGYRQAEGGDLGAVSVWRIGVGERTPVGASHHQLPTTMNPTNPRQPVVVM